MQKMTDLYVYQTSVASIAASANATTTINIRAHADFVIHKLTMFSDVAGAAQSDSTRVLPLVTVQITDTGAGKQFFSDVVPIAALFGDGGLPFILPGPRRVAANATLSFAFNNFSIATTYRLYLLLIGVEHYLQ